jgi:orotidine-5'-phosphate decarboxylase
MTPVALTQLAQSRRSLLCVGLDTDPSKVPACLRGEPDPVVAFNRHIIEATADLAIAYKVNTAFYEAQGVRGWQQLEATLRHLPTQTLNIADAKRGDIGNTATRYAQAFFEALPFDAITVAPYMGRDSVEPFLAFAGKWAFVLGVTSNPGAADFQFQQVEGVPLYRHVVRTVNQYSGPGHLGFVAGATRPAQLGEVRADAPESWLLVPGVGAQGGDMAAVLQHGLAPHLGLLINASRAIQYASSGTDFAEAARRAAQQMVSQMQQAFD